MSRTRVSSVFVGVVCSLLLFAGNAAAQKGGQGKPEHAGHPAAAGKGAEHRSAQGAANSNAQGDPAALRGQERAEERAERRDERAGERERRAEEREKKAEERRERHDERMQKEKGSKQGGTGD
jgi:hypothetical protein